VTDRVRDIAMPTTDETFAAVYRVKRFGPRR
jgi:hypothetical protein